MRGTTSMECLLAFGHRLDAVEVHGEVNLQDYLAVREAVPSGRCHRLYACRDHLGGDVDLGFHRCTTHTRGKVGAGLSRMHSCRFAQPESITPAPSESRRTRIAASDESGMEGGW